MKTLFLSFIFYWVSAACFASSTAPKRVVSMNLCTDQLALLLAGAFTRRETVTLLKRLNHRVEVFQPTH